MPPQEPQEVIWQIIATHQQLIRVTSCVHSWPEMLCDSLVYLNNDIFRELLRMTEEEYGLPKNGPIMLPCDAVFMEYAVSLIRKHAAKDLEKALLVSISADRCLSSSCLPREQSNQ